MHNLIPVILAICTTIYSGFSKSQNPERVIFETDMGNDIDDALALDMLYKFMDQGKVNLLAVCSNKDSKYSAGFIDIMNTWYGYPDIPIGRIVDGVNPENKRTRDYTKAVYEMEINGFPAFARSVKDIEKLPDAVRLYRKVLAQQPDHSVTIISVGFFTNIGRLLDSEGDEYSPLSGKRLVTQKVKKLSIMAGSFGERPIAEFNVVRDIANAQKVFSEWPTPILVTPFEIGIQVEYPGESILDDFHWAGNHPVVESYKAFKKMPYDRPTWDLIAVLNALDSRPEFFSRSEKGRISVDEKGFTKFSGGKKGSHSYIATENAAQV